MADELEELGAPLAGVTPALSCTRSKTLRVSSGTRSMVSAEISWPTVELLVSTSEVVSVTVTTSLYCADVERRVRCRDLVDGDRDVLLRPASQSPSRWR